MKSRERIFENIEKMQTMHYIEETYRFLGDWFEDAVKPQIEKLESIEKDTDNKMKSFDENLTGVTNDNGMPCESDLEIYNEMGGLHNELYETSEQLYAIWEMIFVNLFKTIEISIKTQISTAYPDVNLNDFFKWETVKEFLRSKKIDIGSFPEYKAINEIRLINNNLKHSSEIAEIVCKQNIPEFDGLQYFTSAALKAYYLRNKSVPKFLLKQLGKAIISELYTYSDERLEELAKELKRKMDKETIEKFITKLKPGKRTITFE
jgi:hypothetical protein